jgi:hypothetical protein
MMSVEGTTLKVQQAAYSAVDSAMPTYVTEYRITYNLNSGDVAFKYMGEITGRSSAGILKPYSPVNRIYPRSRLSGCHKFSMQSIIWL